MSNILSDCVSVVSSLNIPYSTGFYKDPAPNEYIVLVPVYDEFGYHADDEPVHDLQYARISIYSKGNYLQTKKSVVNALIAAGITITSRQYIEFEPDTGYHHYNIDVEKIYDLEGT